MYSRVKDIQKLLNMYVEKYKIIRQSLEKALNDFENLSVNTSDSVSEPFIQINNTKRK
jgi:hypothetical protein